MADVALDDYIKTKHITRNSGRGGNKAAVSGAARPTRGARGGKAPMRQSAPLRTARFSAGITKNTQRRSGGGNQTNFSRNSGGGGVSQRWKHDLYGAVGDGGGLRSRSSAGTKLIISNLDYGVSETDIADLFSELGHMVRSSVHYDLSGRSLGTAEIIYARPADAIAALKKYNGVPLDGKAMDIQLVGAGKAVEDAPRRRSFAGQGGRVSGRLGTAPSGRGGRAPATGGRGGRGGRRGGARGGGQARAAKPEVTQEQLDMELDEYQSTKTA